MAKRFMSAHGGYDRSNLQDWMNLIAYILSPPFSRYEKIDQFINLAKGLNTQIITAFFAETDKETVVSIKELSTYAETFCF